MPTPDSRHYQHTLGSVSAILIARQRVVGNKGAERYLPTKRPIMYIQSCRLSGRFFLAIAINQRNKHLIVGLESTLDFAVYQNKAIRAFRPKWSSFKQKEYE